MDRTKRIYHIQKLLQEFRVVSREKFLEELEISLATFKRDLAYLRDRLNAPIEYSLEAGGYRLGVSQPSPSYALPGVWFNAEEIHALLTMRQLLTELQPSLLAPHLVPLVDRLYALLGETGMPEREVSKRIRICRVNGRHACLNIFGPVSVAVLRRRQLRVKHFHRGRDEVQTRVLSPQRLIYYRDNWYLDAWCHLRQDIRSFSLDAINDVELLDDQALNISDTELDAVLNAGYGIFGGANVQWAVLRFSPERARWVSCEFWHPQQQGRFEEDGHYVLKVPYSDDRELVMDVLKHVPEVVVLEPNNLRVRIQDLLNRGLKAMETA